jgi:hypothetical protein
MTDARTLILSVGEVVVISERITEGDLRQLL